MKLMTAGAFVFASLALAGCESSDDGRDIVSSIPDPVFKAYCRLQTEEWDTDGNGVVSISEASAVKKIDLGNKDDWDGDKVASLRGIELFKGLEELYCHNNALVELDLSKNRELVYLNCRSNALKTLKVAGLSKLGRFWCRDNALEELDLAGCTGLGNLDCAVNAIAELDVSPCPLLTEFMCEKNALTSLDISANTALLRFYCSVNPGSGGTFPVTAWFDGGNVPSGFTNADWTYGGATVAPSYVKVVN